jgi:hypothetical protein
MHIVTGDDAFMGDWIALVLAFHAFCLCDQETQTRGQ